jgi:hemerythrin-like domain-containing protein
MASKKMKSRTQEKNAITLLRADHKKVRELLRQLEDSPQKAVSRRETLLEEIERQLQIHTKIEEQIFYPAFRAAAEKKGDTKLYYEALEEHHVVDLVLPEIRKTDAGADEFAAKAKALKDLVEHHADEEEKEMFPRAKKLMDREELRRLGEELAKAKDSLAESANSPDGVLSKLAG